MKRLQISETDKTLTSIAREYLRLTTLETRKSDRLDFSDQAVWCIKEALEKAFEAGAKSVTENKSGPTTRAEMKQVLDLAYERDLVKWSEETSKDGNRYWVPTTTLYDFMRFLVQKP